MALSANTNFTIPYQFVLRYLYPVRPIIRKMFGCYALYHQHKMIFFLRDKSLQPEFNGVFLATQPQFITALQNEIHHSKMQFDLDGSTDSWIFISEDLEDFERRVKAACELIKTGDERIGK